MSRLERQAEMKVRKSQRAAELGRQTATRDREEKVERLRKEIKGTLPKFLAQQRQLSIGATVIVSFPRKSIFGTKYVKGEFDMYALRGGEHSFEILSTGKLARQSSSGVRNAQDIDELARWAVDPRPVDYLPRLEALAEALRAALAQ